MAHKQQRGFSQRAFASAVSAKRLHCTVSSRSELNRAPVANPSLDTTALYRRAPTWAGFAGHGDHDPWANAGLGCSNSLVVLGMFFNLSLQACSGCFPSITAQCGRQYATQPCFNHDNFIARISTLEPKHARPHSLCLSNLGAYATTTDEPLKDKAWLPVSHVLRKSNNFRSLGVLRGLIL